MMRDRPAYEQKVKGNVSHKIPDCFWYIYIYSIVLDYCLIVTHHHVCLPLSIMFDYRLKLFCTMHCNLEIFTYGV